MKILIVFAHPEPQSFNGALKNQAVSTLESCGHTVQTSDLYRQNWKTCLDASDFPGPRLNTDFLNLPAEQEHMSQTSCPTPDVHAEQEKVLWCDLMIFQFPIWWFSMPAILKGWIERVMIRGFAYTTGRKYDKGMLKGRKAMICTTTGTAASSYAPNGIDGDIMHLLWPIHNGIFRYLGFDVLPPYIAWMPASVTMETRQRYLKEYSQHLRQLDQLPLLFFHPREDYDPDQRLKPEITARSGFQWNNRNGQTHKDAAQQFTFKLIKNIK